jgi:hypothetical protein
MVNLCSQRLRSGLWRERLGNSLALGLMAGTST